MFLGQAHQAPPFNFIPLKNRPVTIFLSHETNFKVRILTRIQDARQGRTRNLVSRGDLNWALSRPAWHWKTKCLQAWRRETDLGERDGDGDAERRHHPGQVESGHDERPHRPVTRRRRLQ